MNRSPNAGDRPRIVVTGVGAVTPLGLGAQRLHDGWLSGESGTEDGIGRCSDFDPADTLSKKEIRRTDRFTHFAVARAVQLRGLGVEVDAVLARDLRRNAQ